MPLATHHSSPTTPPHHVVVLGGGFGGLYAVKSLRKAPARVTLVDRRNFHLFQPLLYQVATGALSAGNISAPLRAVLKRRPNLNVMLAEVVDFDLARHEVVLSDGRIHYDTLIVATGATHSYFSHPEWEHLAPGLKSIEDATEIRRRIFSAFEAAERESDPEDVCQWLTFVVAGGGPTGVELAGALAEIARDTLRHQFHRINPADARILLVEGSDRVLPAYPPELSQRAREQLEDLGVTVRTGTLVTDVRPDSVTLKQGDQTEVVRTRTALWAAGVKASPLGKKLAEAAGIPTNRAGRVPVGPDLSLPGHPEVFVIGDLALYEHQGGQPLPGLAPVAMQEGRYVADLVKARLRGKTGTGSEPSEGKTGTGSEPSEVPVPVFPPFHYRDYGMMATIGRNRAVALIRGWKFSGWLAWILWLFIHLMYIVEFTNRVLIFIQWAWNYFTWNRGARLITGESPLPIPTLAHNAGGEETPAIPAERSPVPRISDH